MVTIKLTDEELENIRGGVVDKFVAADDMQTVSGLRKRFDFSWTDLLSAAIDTGGAALGSVFGTRGKNCTNQRPVLH